MRQTLRRTGVLIVLVVLFAAGVGFLLWNLASNGSEWAANRANQHIYSNGTTVNSGSVFDRNGEALAYSEDGERVFNSSKAVRMATLHIVGDTSGFISTGTQSLYRSKLSGYSLFEGIYRLKDGEADAGITLNIYSEACRIAYEALGKYNGTVMVYNYKTGELLCSVSKPTYDAHNVPDNLLTAKKYEGVFLDKAVSGVYTPGSVMKIVTAVAAYKNIPDIDSRTFECNGKYKCDDGSVICNGKHGEVSFEEAFNKSCNSVFAEVSVELGAEKLLAAANSLGFNTQLYSGSVRLAKSHFSPSTTSESELGWAGIGQSTTLINPAHLLSITGAIANSGNGYAPNRIKKFSDFWTNTSPKAQIIVTLDPVIAAKMQKIMRSTVVNKYGDSTFPDLEFCAKTGTAQLDGADSHSWIAGYSSRSDLPLAAVCIVENGGWGSGPATKVTNKVMQYFLDEYTN